MSRYKKIVFGEKETKEINGVKYLLYPTMESRMLILDTIKEIQAFEEKDIKDAKGKIIETIKIRKGMDAPKLINVCSQIVYEACFDHDADGKRLSKKETEKDTSIDDIKYTITSSGEVMTIFMEIATELGLLSQDKKNELDKKLEDSKKKLN